METGVFDVAAPLLSAADRALSATLPAGFRLMLWAAAAASLSMGLYWLLSPQQALTRLAGEATQARRDLASYDGPIGGLWPRMNSALSLSVKHLAYAFVPALAGAAPVLLMIGWVAGAFGYSMPAPGKTVTVTTVPASAGLTLEKAEPAGSPGEWKVRWPAVESPSTVRDSSGAPLATLPLALAVPVLHKRQWWNTLYANPLGYLPADSPVDAIEIDLPAQEFLPIGPVWLRGWLSSFMIAVFAFSLAIKFTFRIR